MATGIANTNGGNITVTADSAATLEITVSNAENTTGISANTGGAHTTGSVTLEGYANVTVNATTTGSYKYAYGMNGYVNAAVRGNASFKAACVGATNGYGYGIYAASGVTVNTTGTVDIDVTGCSGPSSVGCIGGTSAHTLTKVGNMKLKYPANGGAISPAADFPTATHATNKDTINRVVSYRYGTPYTVTVTNGTANVDSLMNKETAQFLTGDAVSVTAKTIESVPFKNWTTADVSVAATSPATFTMPAKAVTLTANYDMFATQPSFTRLSNTTGSVSWALRVQDSNGSNSYKLVKADDLTEVLSYIGKGTTYEPTQIPAGTYRIAANVQGYTSYGTFYSEPFTVNYNTTDPAATVGNVTVSGTKGTAITSTDVTVTLTNDTFASTLSGNWITNLPAGLTQNVTRTDDTHAKIIVTGTPTATSTAAMTIVIPDAQLVTSDTDLTVTANANAKFNITLKSISGATITLGTLPTYDGSEQTVTISKVEVGGSTLNTSDYEITSGNKATNVGNTTLTITGKGNYDGTATTTWSLQKATPTAADFNVTTPTAVNYDGSAKAVAAPTLKSGKTGAGAVTVKYGSSTTAPTDVGSYTVTFDVAEGQNYKEATGLSIGMLTINKVNYTGTKTASATVRSGQTTANATLTLPALPTGASYAASGTVGGTNALISSHSISGTTLTYSTTSQTGGTSATITIAVTGATNYNDYNVVVTVTAKNKDAATVSLTGTVPTSKTYGDANFNVTASAEHTEAGGAWTWTSSNESVLKVTGTSTTGTVQVVGQGNATITAKYESANYLGEATSASITVNKKNVTITGLSAQNKVYDGNTTATVSGTAVVSGKVGSDDVTVTTGSAAFSDKNVGNGKTVTFTGYSLGGAKAGNYNLTDQPASVTANITAKDVTITGVTATTRAYVSGNKSVALTGGTVTGAVSGDTVTVDLTNATGTMTDEDAGTNKAVAVTGVALGGTDKGNYHLTAQPTGVTVTISKATYASSITANKNVKTNTALTGVEVDMSAKFGVIKGAAVKSAAENSDTDNIIDNVSVSGNIVKFDVASVAAADKTATINVVISCTNFEDITAVLTVKTVDKDEAGVTISGVPTEAKTYGDADLTLTGAVTAAGTGTGNWTWEASDPTVLQVTGTGNTAKVKLLKAGSATVTAKYESDTTIGQLTTANIRVNKATVTVTAKDQSIYVNGTAPDLTSPVKDTHYTVTGLASGDTLGGTIAMKYQKDGSDAAPDVTKTGTYDIVISGATAPAGGNYNDVVFAKGTLTIASRPSSGGGSSSGSSGSTITVPVSDPKNQIKVTASVSGSTATVQKMDLSKIDPAQGATIDFTGLGKTIESAKLPTSAIKEIGATEGGTLTVKLTAGNVTFDTAALKAVADQAGSQITLTLTPAKTSALNASQKEAVGDAPVFDLRLLGGSKAITDFKGGNVTVTLPHTLSEGQNPAGVVAYYLSNDGNPEACKTTYDTKNKLVTFTTTHFSLYFVGYEQPAAEWKNPFTDVAEGAWYFDSVKYVHSEGMMVGTSATKFSPDATTTRGMVVTILYRLEGEPAVSGKSTFADVVGTAWYANAVEWAAKNKIVDGYGNGKFGPEDVITREQMVAILYRYAAFKGLDMTKTADLSKFTDSGKISSWAKPALSWANAEGLISGKSGGILDPLGSATRAEAAAILHRFCENVVK